MGSLWLGSQREAVQRQAHQPRSAPQLCPGAETRCPVLQEVDTEEQRARAQGNPARARPLSVVPVLLPGMHPSLNTSFRGSWGIWEWVLRFKFQWLQALTAAVSIPVVGIRLQVWSLPSAVRPQVSQTVPGWRLHTSGSSCVHFLSSEAWSLSGMEVSSDFL